jgi:hypothetical protein
VRNQRHKGVRVVARSLRTQQRAYGRDGLRRRGSAPAGQAPTDRAGGRSSELVSVPPVSTAGAASDQRIGSSTNRSGHRGIAMPDAP